MIPTDDDTATRKIAMSAAGAGNAELAALVKAWRGRVPAREAAGALGISPRTLQGIEQGRGFRYPKLLRVAMQAVELNEGTNG